MNNQTTEESQKRLKSLLRRLFQFDVSKDLEFGIYRIMNKKRDEIEKFIEKDLIEKTEEAFQEYIGTSTETLQNQLEDLKSEINASFGAGTIDDHGEIKNYHDAPKVQKYANMQRELEQAELTKGQIDDVYNHVYEFFGRYFDKGDFISKLRYGGKDKYVIPYNGEEVMLHWANKDHYYIKTTEHFTNYEFKAGKWKVHFMITQAEVERNNIKGENRYFILDKNQKINIDEKNKELSIFFQYKGLNSEEIKDYGKRNVQEVITKNAYNKIISTVKGNEIENPLSKKDGENTQLEKHLNRYVTKNTSDYFIHKDLKRFLVRELEFYIKNEVLQLDEIAGMDERAIRQNMARVKAINDIGAYIIEFLAQIEDFQKMLFEKKKMVLRADYCMTLDMVPKKFYSEIAQNKDQVAEWKRILNLDEFTKGKIHKSVGNDTLTTEFLESYPSLILDTKFYNQEFTDKLISTFTNIDENVSGLMIKSENWQALNQLTSKYNEAIKCIYIDPPYNTGNDEFIYKDNYQHSSWFSLLSDRIALSKQLLRDDGIICISIDDHEVNNLRSILNEIFGEENFLAQIIVQSNKRGQTYKQISKTHEYVLIYTKHPDVGVNELEKEGDKDDLNLEDDIGPFNIRELRNRNPKFGKHNRPNLFYPIFLNPSVKDKDDFSPISLIQREGYSEKIEPFNSEGRESCWRWHIPTLEKNYNENTLVSNVVAKEKRDGGFNIYEKYRKSTYKAKSIWTETEVITEQGTIELGKLGLAKLFDFPKPIGLLSKIITIGSGTDDIILDYFAGSGTTAHSIINLEGLHSTNRKYLLIEMGDCFDNVMKTRIQKLMFSKEWKDGKPISNVGHSHMFKYMYLEQYEDTLSNIVFRAKDKTVQETLDTFDDYFVRYMLEYETRESPTRLATNNFEDPFGYKIKTISGNEEKIESVDLVETFNYLLGLEVENIRAVKDGERYYKVVKGRMPDENTAMVVWRNTEEIDYKRDKQFIEKNFLADRKTDILYVNGMCHVETSKSIEPDFKRLMGA